MGKPNPYAITMARELRQVSQVALCEAVGVNQSTLSKIETESAVADHELIEKIARALKLPTNFFYVEWSYNTLPQTFYRKFNIKQSEAKSIQANLNRQCAQVRRLLQSIETPKTSCPKVDLDEYCGSIEQLASELRLYFRVPPGPIGNLTDLLETNGIVVVEADFSSNKVDAVSVHDNDLPPLIFASRNFPGDRFRFTLAHELAHVILHHGRFIVKAVEELEQEANEFASAFLMPEREIRSHFSSGLTLEKLAKLKVHWKVSMQALIMRAASLGAISDSQKRRLFMQMGKLGYRRHEPVSIEREKPTFLTSLIRFHLTELGYGEADLSNVLMVLEDEFRAIYPDVFSSLRPKLRLL